MLVIENLHVAYGESRALSGVSLEVGAGEVVALVGSNGAGKTTLLNTISGLVKPRAGHIRFDGASIEGLPPHDIFARGITHVPEGRHVFPTLTVLENLRIGGLYSKARAKLERRIDELFEQFPILSERRAQLAGSLSGGEQQILAICRGLVSEPRCLLLDEPSLGLSPIKSREVFSVISSIADTRIPILLVEQDVYAALELARRGYVLDVGRITLSGEAGTLADDPQLRRAYLGLDD